MQSSHLANRYFLAVCINDLRFVPRNDAAERTRLDVSRPVGDVDVKHLRRADAVADINAVSIHPALVELDRQSFTRRVTEPQAREILARRAGHVEHRIDHRRHGGENCRTITLDDFEHLLGSGAFGEQRGSAPDCEGEQKIGTRSVAKEQFGNRNGQIVGVDAHRRLREHFCVVRQIVLQVDRAFRVAR